MGKLYRADITVYGFHEALTTTNRNIPHGLSNPIHLRTMGGEYVKCPMRALVESDDGRLVLLSVFS